MSKKRASRALPPKEKEASEVRERFRVGVKWAATRKLWADLKQIAMADRSNTLVDDFKLENEKRLKSLDRGHAQMHTVVCTMLACPASWGELGPFPSRQDLAVAGYQSVDLKLRTGATTPRDDAVLIDRDSIVSVLVAISHKKFRERVQSACSDDMTDVDWNELATEISPRLKELGARKLSAERLKATVTKYRHAIVKCRDAIPASYRMLNVEEEGES